MVSLRWPLFGLRVVTPRLELRYMDDELARQLAEVAVEGVHAPDYMPFSVPWTRQAAEVLRSEYVKHHWGKRATFTADDWTLAMAVLVDGEPVGCQDAFAKQFRITRQLETGSWLGLRHQGRGIGTEMRAAILHLAFEGLGAERACSGAWVDNPSSQAVTRKHGYTENGWDVMAREGEPCRMLRFALRREAWLPRRRDDISIEGLEPCLPILGLDA